MAILRWALLVALAIPLQAEAVLVARDLTLNPDNSPNPAYRWINESRGVLTYDTDTRLEWVDLTETDGYGRTWSSAPDDGQHNPFLAGWRYATHAEICGLLEPRTGPVRGCGGGTFDFGSYEGVAEIQDFLGVTREYGSLRLSAGIFETGWLEMGVNPDNGFAQLYVVESPDYPPHYGADFGHFLVRVPEPHALVLLILALGGVTVRAAR